mmetsp:Transcript_4222/g.13484  ORF Transcript_4222/g.13484 Transcript_4222/m.13484 type:complete len:329 (-) Transcript_4222:36-1022(-)
MLREVDANLEQEDRDEVQRLHRSEPLALRVPQQHHRHMRQLLHALDGVGAHVLEELLHGALLEDEGFDLHEVVRNEQRDEAVVVAVQRRVERHSLQHQQEGVRRGAREREHEHPHNKETRRGRRLRRPRRLRCRRRPAPVARGPFGGVGAVDGKPQRLGRVVVEGREHLLAHVAQVEDDVELQDRRPAHGVVPERVQVHRRVGRDGEDEGHQTREHEVRRQHVAARHGPRRAKQPQRHEQHLEQHAQAAQDAVAEAKLKRWQQRRHPPELFERVQQRRLAPCGLVVIPNNARRLSPRRPDVVPETHSEGGSEAKLCREISASSVQAAS